MITEITVTVGLKWWVKYAAIPAYLISGRLLYFVIKHGVYVK